MGWGCGNLLVVMLGYVVRLDSVCGLLCMVMVMVISDGRGTC